jgi:hypothetical protein
LKLSITKGNLSALSVFAGAVLPILSVFIGLPLAYFINSDFLDSAVLLCLFSGVFFSFLHCGLALFIKCPLCENRLTVLGLKKPHPKSTAENGTEVAFYWFSGKVVCIHCGESIETKDI